MLNSNFVLIFGEKCMSDFSDVYREKTVTYEDVKNFIRVQFYDRFENFLFVNHIPNKERYLNPELHEQYLSDKIYERMNDTLFREIVSDTV